MSDVKTEFTPKEIAEMQLQLKAAQGSLKIANDMMTAVVTTLGRVGPPLTPPVINQINNTVTGTGNNQNTFSGTWAQGTKTGMYQGDYSYSNTTGSYVEFKGYFYKLDLITEVYPSHGIVNVTVDGVSDGTIDMYNANPAGLQQYLAYSTGNLTEGIHTVRFTVSGTKNPASTGFYFVYDSVKTYATQSSPIPPPVDDEYDYYVATTGNDTTGDGSAALPYLTIQKAATVATTGQTVAIRGGTYRETITPTNNGVRFIAYPTETVIISGLTAVSNGAWSVHSGNIYKATVTLPAATNFNQDTGGSNTTLLANQVFKDGEMQHLARWPKVSTMADLFDRTKFRPRSSTTTFNTTTITDAGLPASLVGGWVSFSGWILTQTRQILTHVGNTITFATTNNDAGDNFRQFYYVTGTLGLLTQAKEWFYSGGTLYFWQQGGGSPTGVEFKSRNWAFNLVGKTGTTITGIRFEGCDPCITSTASTATTLDNIKANYMNHNFLQMLPGANYFYSAKQVGLKLLGSGSILRNSEIAYAGAHGVWLGTNCTAENNLIHSIAYDGMWGCGVMPWEGSTSGQVITRNTIHNMGRSCVNLADNVASHLNMDISYNDMYNHTRLNIDNGAIYGGIHVNLTGTRIHHNWFHDIGTQAIGTLNGLQVTGTYMDQASGPITLDHNVHWGPQTSVAGCDWYTEPKNASNDTGGHNLYNNTMWSTPVYATYINWNATVQDRQKNNIYRHPINIGGVFGATGNQQTCITSSTNPLFVGGSLSSPQEYFQLQAGSPGVNAGTVISGITDGSVGTPDIGAYERGGGKWLAGYTPVQYNP